MTVWEVLIGAPATFVFMIIIILAVIGFSLLIVGLPFLVVNFYKNHKNQENQAKISFWKILYKTYF